MDTKTVPISSEQSYPGWAVRILLRKARGNLGGSLKLLSNETKEKFILEVRPQFST